MMIFRIDLSVKKMDFQIKTPDHKAFTLVLVLIFSLLLIKTAVPEAVALEDEPTVLIRDFDFYLVHRAVETEAAKMLKQRRLQLQTIISAEKSNLEQASDLTKKNIEAHIKFLEDSLEDIDEEIAGEGDTKVPRKVLHEVLEEYKNRELTYDDMREAADRVEMAYVERGYLLAKAYLPVEEDGGIENGVLKIGISEGNVGEVKIDGQTYYKDRVIRRNFLEQVKHGVFREDIMSRDILLSKESIPSLKTSIKLAKGDKPGTTNLVISAEDRLAIDWNLDFNNFGSKYVGKERYGTRVDITDPWWGSTLSIRGVTGNDIEDSSLVSGDWSIPLNIYGTRLNLNYLNGQYIVGQDLADLGIDGSTSIYGLSISQPLIRERRQSLTFSLGYNNKYTKSYRFNELDSIDDVDVFHAVLDYDSLDRYLGKNLVTMGYYWGSLNPDNEFPLTRTTAEYRFHKYYLSAVRIQRVYGPVNFILKASGQISNQNLVPIEQMAIGGYGTVRGHDTSMYLGDSGFTLSGEFISAPPYIGKKILLGQRLSQMVQFAFFYDYGRVYNANPGRGEYKDENLKGYGTGLRLYYKDIFSFKFDVAFPTEKKNEGEDSTAFYFFGNINITSEEMPKLLNKIRNIWRD